MLSCQLKLYNIFNMILLLLNFFFFLQHYILDLVYITKKNSLFFVSLLFVWFYSFLSNCHRYHTEHPGKFLSIMWLNREKTIDSLMAITPKSKIKIFKYNDNNYNNTQRLILWWFFFHMISDGSQFNTRIRASPFL